MTRHFIRLAAVACIAPLVSACAGGGGSRTIPAPPTQPGAPAPSAAAGVPQGAVNGVMVSVHLPLRNSDELDALIARQTDKSSADYRHFLTPEQFRAKFAPSQADLNTAASTLRGLGFDTHATSQAILASAPQPVVERAFQVKLRAVQTHDRRAESITRGALTATKAPVLPPALAKLGATLGFSAGVRHVDSKIVGTAAYVPDNRYSTVGPYWFTVSSRRTATPRTRLRTARAAASPS